MELVLLEAGRSVATTCSIDGCTTNTWAKGWCKKHYYGYREMPECVIEGCEKRAEKRGWCSGHYQRWRMHGDVNYVSPSGRTECCIEGCSKGRQSEQGWCNMHYMRWKRTGTTDPKVRIRKPDHARCSACKQEKHLTKFSSTPSNYDGVSSYCKSCAAQRKKAERDADKIAVTRRDRGYRIKAKHGLTLDEYDAIFAAQDGRCATCARPPAGTGGYHLDHDHNTGEVRGFLCHHCNVTLGNVQDSVEILSALIAYLQDPPARHLLKGKPMSPPAERSA